MAHRGHSVRNGIAEAAAGFHDTDNRAARPAVTGEGEASMSDLGKLISRVLLSSVFIFYGYSALTNVNGWMKFNQAALKRFFDMIGGGSAPLWFGYLIALVMLLGGIAILLGFMTRWVSWGFVIFLILTLYFAHHFWDMEGAARGGNTAHFYKNLAIIGGFLLLALSGPGRMSIDREGPPT
jgi:putative oxidoreductase